MRAHVVSDKWRERMKLGELDRINLLEDTFKPISKPLSELIDNFKNSNKYNVTNYNGKDQIWEAVSVK